MLTYLQYLPKDLRNILYDYQDYSRLEPYRLNSVFYKPRHVIIDTIYCRFYVGMPPTIEFIMGIDSNTTNKEFFTRLCNACGQDLDSTVIVHKFGKKYLTMITDVSQYKQNNCYLVEFHQSNIN